MKLFTSFLATGIARSISPGQVLRQDSSNMLSSGNASNVATIIRAHSSVQQQSATPPQPPVKKSQFGAANLIGQRVPPPIPPNKPIINKSIATASSASNSRITFLQSQATVPGISGAAQAIAAQNAKDGDE